MKVATKTEQKAKLAKKAKKAKAETVVEPDEERVPKDPKGDCSTT